MIKWSTDWQRILLGTVVRMSLWGGPHVNKLETFRSGALPLALVFFRPNHALCCDMGQFSDLGCLTLEESLLYCVVLGSCPQRVSWPWPFAEIVVTVFAVRTKKSVPSAEAFVLRLGQTPGSGSLWFGYGAMFSLVFPQGYLDGIRWEIIAHGGVIGLIAATFVWRGDSTWAERPIQFTLCFGMNSFVYVGPQCTLL